jgi:hypothetical protein
VIVGNVRSIRVELSMFAYPRRAFRINSRLYASASLNPLTSPTPSAFRIFDRHAKLLQKNRAAALNGGEISRQVDYVRDEVANRMIERFMARQTFIFSKGIAHLAIVGYQASIRISVGFGLRPRSFQQATAIYVGEQSYYAGSKW